MNRSQFVKTDIGIGYFKMVRSTTLLLTDGFVQAMNAFEMSFCQNYEL
jgi:hypothetical protein